MMWNYIAGYTLFTVSFVMLGRVFVRRAAFLEYPTLAAMATLGFLGPQVWALLHDPLTDQQALAGLLVLMTACLVAVWAGWVWGVRRAHRSAPPPPLDRDVLTAGLATLLVIALVANLKIRSLPVEITSKSQWTGAITIYAFFGQLAYPVMAFGAVLWLRERSRVSGVLVLTAFFSVADLVLLAGRREPLGFLVIAALCALFFWRGWAPPRALSLALFVIGVLFINNAGEYRSATNAAYVLAEDRRPPLREVVSRLEAIPWVDNVLARRPDTSYELANAVAVFKATGPTTVIGWGAAWWNVLVQAYVPGQILGFDFKEGLKLERGRITSYLGNYVPHTGSTITGFADAYFNLWVFSPVVFFFISWFLGWLFTNAVRGSVAAAGVYAVFAIKGINAITHQTGNFIVELVFVGVFIGPLLVAARGMSGGRQRCLLRLPDNQQRHNQPRSRRRRHIRPALLSALGRR